MSTIPWWTFVGIGFAAGTAFGIALSDLLWRAEKRLIRGILNRQAERVAKESK